MTSLKIMQKNWKIKKPNLTLQRKISQALEISSLCAQILINRGVSDSKEASQFLDSDLKDLHNPFLFKGMRKAVRRIKKAISDGEKIMVWGDYDIDGITSVALLLFVLRSMDADAIHYIPNRLEEGYGLNKKGADQAKKKKVKLLITVDCGVSAYQEIEHLNKLGIDTIVTDHHQPKDSSLPKSLCIINPLQKDCSYPYKYLAGVGVAFKLACALLGKEQEVLDKYLDLVVLGTVGDVVPLTGENRTLVKSGLAVFAQTKNLGLKALMDASGLKDRQISARHIGYILGPRINASGRLGSPEDSLKLLMSKTELEAHHLAEKLGKGNRTRQRIESQTLQEAIEQVEKDINFKDHNIIVLGAENWHQGVIGIVASRLVDRYLRPAIIMSLEDDFGRGSGRSIGNFHLLKALIECKDLLEEYGGHQRACGIRIKKKKFAKFIQAINHVAKKMLTPEDLIPTVDIDAKVRLCDLNERLIEELESLAPFGTENPSPIICSSDLTIKTRPMVVARKHIKFWVTGGGLTCEAIGYNKAEVFGELKVNQLISLAYAPSINNWQGNFSIQLKIEDLKISSN